MKSFKLNLFVIATFSSLPIYAKVVEIDLSLYGKGTMLANSARDRQSADYWHQLSNRIIASEAKLGTQAMWQYAGLSEALAAIAANKYDDVKAYEYWSNSTRYLLTGGTEWTQMQKYLHRRYEQINTQLSTQLNVSNIGVSLDSKWQQELTILQIWEEKLHVFTFKGPKLGLQAHSSKASSIVPINTPTFKPKRATTGEKKLTGLTTSFSREQTFAPTIESAASNTDKEVQDIKTSVITEASEFTHDEIKTQKAASAFDPRAEEKPLMITVDMNEKESLKLPPSEKSADEVMSLADPNVVVITPDDEFDYQKAEKEHRDNLAEKKSTYAPIHKANIGTENENKVEALQRRTFTPMIED